MPGNRESIAATPEGFFRASLDGARRVSFTFGSPPLTLANLSTWYRLRSLCAASHYRLADCSTVKRQTEVCRTFDR